MKLARVYVIKASGHPGFRLAGVKHCLVPGSGQRHRSRTFGDELA
jgi:hypothetical protein